MDDPIKVIFKFKNNNRRIQYHIYIFIGKISDDIMKILKQIQDKSLYDSLVFLSSSDYNKLIYYYGELWYKKFFNTYHINSTIQIIKKNPQQQRELLDKYGKEWYEKHIEKFKLIEKKIFYSYGALIKDELIRKEIKKKKVKPKEEEKGENIDYTTVRKEKRDKYQPISIQHKKDTNNIETKKDKFGGYEYSIDYEFTKELTKKLKNYEPINYNFLIGGDYEYNKEIDEDKDKVIEFDEGLEMNELMPDEELDMEEIEKIYQEVDVNPDENILQTSKLIKKALKDEEYIKKTKEELLEFDTSKDDLMYDDDLKNVYYKNYVINQYIFKDDTIKTIKAKITCSIKNNPKFEKNAFIVPSRQYLWSEYYFDDKKEKVMIGQKWIIVTDILKIDIEPNNNIRVYEELRGNLKILRDNIKRYGSKIKREDDDFNILYDYEDYMTNNEIYLIDIYNELGKGYSPGSEELKNIIDVYMKIYFPRIKLDDIKYIIDYLNGDIKVESSKISSIYETLNNDLIIENQIMYDVESVKKTPVYKTLFKENYITQSVIHVNLRLLENTKIDLFRIFNEFIMTPTYPFIQYRTPDGQIIFKYSETDIMEFGKVKENIDVLSKWFETAPYGISFKVKIIEKGSEKFMAINLSDTGRIEYKTQWKEEDMATIEDIKKTYNYVKDLIRKLNSEKNKVKIDIPEDIEFRYAFINSIQKFELPEKFIINHNDLSEFSRYFYPYVALVIEPRKRLAKIKKESDKSKFGTYLRYKRVSKYENQSRIEQRILYFMRNYDYNDISLANEIGKQFNITLERAMEEIERVRNKYPNIKKSRKILKKLENIPKYKPPGIGIDIQGKQRDRYKIRISGARNKDQLDRIITFMNILIYLYTETYLYKKPERQILKEKLKKLTNIARRRAKVDVIVNYEKTTKTVKQMAQIDKKRIGFKPEKGQNQWTRSCQNSGTDKKRRPQQYLVLDDILAQGFKLNKKTGIYEKTITLKSKKKSKDIIIKAVGLKSTDEEGKDIGTIYYSCNPDDNGTHMFIGFLSRSNNPYGQCMPCCFKKDPFISKNKAKRDYNFKCIGKDQEVTIEKEKLKIIGDQLYILQDTNKIQEGRLGFLPKYLDFFLNQSFNKTKKIKHHYLVSTKGYFFKYGTRQEDYPFLNAIASIFNKTASEIKDILIEKLSQDKDNLLFTAINNGDIRTSFLTRDKFIEFIKNSKQLTFELLNHFLSIPNVITSNGLNIIVFEKKTILIRKKLEKEKTRDDFTIMCQNEEELDNLKDPNRDTILMIKELKNFNPIVFVIKNDEMSKNIDIIKIFKYEEKDDNIINHIMDFYVKNCQTNIIKDIGYRKSNINAKTAYKILMQLKNKNYFPKFQVIDARNKCKYLITNDSTIIPVKPSGTIYNIRIIKHFEIKFLSVVETIERLNNLYELSKNRLPIKPIGVYFTAKTDTHVNVIAITTETYDSVPVIEENVEISWLNKKGLIMEFKQLFDKIDEEIIKGKSNFIVDERIRYIKNSKYINESYELFRLELSQFLNKPENDGLKKKIEKIITSDIPKNEKKKFLRGLLYKIIDKHLYRLYEKISSEQTGGKVEKIFDIVNKLPDLTNYDVQNIRETCDTYNTRNKCETNLHCKWKSDNCRMALTREMIITFVNKLSEELANNDLKASEVLQRENYFVSDIVDYNKFTERPGQKIIKSNSTSINKILTDLFGKESIPIIGKRSSIKLQDIDYQHINTLNPLKDLGYMFTQKIIDNNLTIYRAYANGYSWIKHQYYDIESRNLGYYSILQTDLANYFRSIVIDWIADKNNKKEIETTLFSYIDIIKEQDIISYLINKISTDIITSTNGVIEYHVLSKMYEIPILVYDDHNNIIYIFDNGIIFDRKKNNKHHEKYNDNETLRNAINIKFSFIGESKIPTDIEVIYFK